METYGLSREQLLEIEYYLRLTRTLEERLVALFRQAKVIGGLFRSLGQEGESVAAAYALDYKQGDVVQPLIRNMGAILVAGAKPADIIKQYMAEGDSPTRGRELNIHFGHPARDGFIGQISMLGDMIPVMAGIALAGRMQKKSLVTLAFIGDGAHDNQSYVPAEVLEEWKAKDPLARFEQALIDGGIAADFTAIQERVRRDVDEATDEAERSPMPRGEEAALGLYAGDGYWDDDDLSSRA